MNHILIIEDEIEIIKAATLLLEAKGFMVSSCKRGDLAADLVKDKSPDIVLLDLSLPFLSGIEVCKKIRLFSDLPIIVITADKSPKNVIELYSLGVDDILSKSFSIKELHLRINSVIETLYVTVKVASTF